MPSLKNINKPNNQKVVKILNALKVLVGAVSGAAYLNDKPEMAFYLLAGGGLVDALLSIFSSKD